MANTSKSTGRVERRHVRRRSETSREERPRKLYPVERKVLQILAAGGRGDNRRDHRRHLTINDIKSGLQMAAVGESWKVERAVNNLSRMQLINKDDISRKVYITKRGLRIAQRLTVSRG